MIARLPLEVTGRGGPSRAEFVDAALADPSFARWLAAQPRRSWSNAFAFPAEGRGGWASTARARRAAARASSRSTRGPARCSPASCPDYSSQPHTPDGERTWKQRGHVADRMAAVSAAASAASVAARVAAAFAER